MTDLEPFAGYLRHKARLAREVGMSDYADGMETAAADAELWEDSIKKTVALYGEDGALLELAHLTSYDGPIEESGTDEELELGNDSAPPCGPSCPGDCGYDPTDPDDPCGVQDYPCASGCKPSEGNVCGGPRCT